MCTFVAVWWVSLARVGSSQQALGRPRMSGSCYRQRHPREGTRREGGKELGVIEYVKASHQKRKVHSEINRNVAVMMAFGRIIVEVYDADGFRGHYEPAKTPARRYNELDVARFVRETVRTWPGCGDAPLRYCVDGDDVIVAVFLDCQPHDLPSKGNAIKIDETLGAPSTDV